MSQFISPSGRAIKPSRLVAMKTRPFQVLSAIFCRYVGEVGSRAVCNNRSLRDPGLRVVSHVDVQNLNMNQPQMSLIGPTLVSQPLLPEYS